jgi:nucleoside-diphosphate-sugar epimerase
MIPKFNSVMIAGASGYIGSNLLAYLLQHQCKVTCIVRSEAAQREIESKFRNLEFVSYEKDDERIIKKLIEDKTDIVFNLASKFVVNHAPNDIDELISSNIKFSTHIFESMRVAGVKNVVTTGTSWQYFRDDEKVAANLYAATKSASDEILKFYVDAYGFNATRLIIFDTYGIGDRRPKLIPRLLGSSPDDVIEMSAGEQRIDLVYISDVIQAYIQAASLLVDQRGLLSEYTVRTGRPVDLRSLVELCSIIFNKEINVRWGALPYRPREIMVPWSGGFRVPGWKPSVGLEAGLKMVSQCL